MSKTQPIIIKRKKHAAHGHHGGAWKVAYADFVTAMMAFFLVMWILGQSQQVKAGVAGYFRDPGVLDQQYSTGILPGSTTGIDAGGPADTSATAAVEDIDQQTLERSAQRIRELLAGLPEFENLKGQVRIEATSEGLRIELIDSSQSTFFDSASAVLTPATERILGVIAHELSTLDKPVVIEGHTDSRPYTKGDGYTNWELSSDRANAARRQMERTGLKPALVRAVRGFADKQLANPADPLDSRNRRVSILVVGHVVAAPKAGGEGAPAAAPGGPAGGVH
jgi:chemotaxis protein MotB